MPHPPKRGSSWLGTRPRVHLGFLRSWRTNGLNERVLEHIRELVDGQQMDIGLVNVYITGVPRCAWAKGLLHHINPGECAASEQTKHNSISKQLCCRLLLIFINCALCMT